jgi:3-hydroxyacyl-CoA dehydrogenase
MPDARPVSVVGAGDMGYGFAIHFTLEGQDVTLIDVDESVLADARERIRGSVSLLAERGITDRDPEAVVEAIDYTTDAAAGVADAAVVLEAVSEDLELKRAVFREVAAAAPGDAILASNTSGIPITEIAEAVPEAADRVAGCHWWFPPFLLTPVEVIRGAETSDETIRELTAFVEAIDRDPIHVEKDVPGFVWNRIQGAIARECMYLVEEGVASVEDINRAIRDGYAVRTAATGPFETLDLAGLDLVKIGAERRYPELSDADAPPDVLVDLVESGRTGVTAGSGFFEYDRPADEVIRDRDATVATIQQCLGRLPGGD